MTKIQKGKKRTLDLFVKDCPLVGTAIPLEGNCMEVIDIYGPERTRMMKVLAQAYGSWGSYVKPKCNYALGITESPGATNIVCSYKKK